MSDKLAKMAEHSLSNVTSYPNEVHTESGYGTLPAYCDKCTGFLDFARINDRTVLKCRECDNVVDLH